MLIIGQEDAVVAALSRALAERDVDGECLVPVPQHKAELMRRFLGGGARRVAVIEPLHRLGAGAGDRPGVSLAAVIAAASVAGASRLVVVTGRGGDDEEILALRRSGVPYVVVRARDVIELAPGVAAAGSRVVVPPAVAEQAASGVVLAEVIEAACAALTDAALVGRTVDVGELGAGRGGAPIERLLRGAGFQPVMAGRVGGVLRKLVGQRLVQVGDDGLVCVS